MEALLENQDLARLILGSILTVGGLAFLYKVLFGSRSVADAVVAWRSKRLSTNQSTSSSLEKPKDDAPSDTEILALFRLANITSHSRMRFGDPTITVADIQTTSDFGKLRITDVYTPLSVATEFVPNDSDQLVNTPGQKRQLVTDALDRPESRCALILGGPGAGKSTLIDILVCSNSDDTSEATPVHIRLAELQEVSDRGFWESVDEVQSTTEKMGLPSASLLSLLEREGRSGNLLLFFDGLDEVPDHFVGDITRLIIEWAGNFNKCRIVVTCRTNDYNQSGVEIKLPFAKLNLLPFDLTDMIDYIDKWYSALERIDFVSEAAARKRNLQDALRNSTELSLLASTPLLLTLMALVHTTEGELPKSRALLYQRTVSHLMAESPRWRRRFARATVSLSEIQPILERIAFELYSKELDVAKTVVGLGIQEIEEIIVSHMELNKIKDHASYRRVRSRIDLMLQRLVDSNGLIVETKKGLLGFSHRSIQEFLAGLHFLSLSSIEFAKKHARDPHWREPMILMAGYGGREGHAIFFITKLIEELTNEAMAGSASDRRMAVLSGEMLAEIGAETLRTKGQGWLIDGADELGDRPSVWRHVVQLLSDSARVVDVRDRVSIFRVLSKIGDERFVSSSGELVSPLVRLSYLPLVDIEVGDDDPKRPKPKSELVDTVPIRRIRVQGMHVSRFPVTNIDYTGFLEAGGYEQLDLWPEEGVRWLRGDKVFQKELQKKTKEWIERDYGPELKVGKYRLEDILRESEYMAHPRQEPFFWRNERYNQANQPVVGINLWEAVAYCKWVEKSLRAQHLIAPTSTARLPTEWEWERAARGTHSRSIYPWGDEPPTSDHAHTRVDGLELDYATPVGCFMSGRSSYDLEDMAGNVWEWTLSRALPPTSEFDSERMNISGGKDVVVRGGSWFSDEPQSIRCGYRGIDLPQNVYYDVGCRVFFFDLELREPVNEYERPQAVGREASARSNRPF